MNGCLWATGRKVSIMPRARRAAEASSSITWDTVREIAQELPGAEEGTSYCTPAFRVRGSLFVRLHDSGESLVVKIDPDERTMRMKVDPETYHITEHYRPYPYMLVRLSTVSRDDLRDLLVESWRLSAPKRLLAAYDKKG
jgi:hypothetical protein